MSRRKSYRCRFARSNKWFDKLADWAGFQKQCCHQVAAKKARLGLLALENRIVPAGEPFGLINSFAIEPDGTTATSSVTLVDGKTYTIVVSGDVGADEAPRRDAEYYQLDEGNNDLNPNEFNVGIRFTGVEGLPGEEENWWGEYCASHVYRMEVVGNDSKITAVYQTDENLKSLVGIGRFTLEIYEGKLKPHTEVPVDPNCPVCVAGVKTEPAFFQSPGPAVSLGGVRYANGIVNLTDIDLVSNGFGLPWGQSRTWTNDPAFNKCCTNVNGAGFTNLPYLESTDDGDAIVLVDCGTTHYFDVVGGKYVPRHYFKETLAKDGDDFIFTDTTGAKLRFNPLDDGPECSRGQVTEYTDPYGNVITITRGGDGKVTVVVRTNGEFGEETFEFQYADESPSFQLVSNVLWKQNDVTVRSVSYTYHDGTTDQGSAGTLRTATIRDANGDPIETTYYRWYMTDSEGPGFNNALKFVVRKASFDRMIEGEAPTDDDPDLINDDDVAVYSDFYFEYDSSHRVTRQKIQGAGCSSCFGGIGDYTYTYEASELDVPVGYNHWATKTTETLADGNQNIIYSNAYGQVMMFVFKDTTTGQQWISHYVYDGQGRLIQKANPSAVTNLNESDPTLAITENVRAELSPEFRVNSHTTGLQSMPNVARNWDGDYVIAWASNSQDGSNLGVYGQRYNAAGQPQGVEFIANTYTTGGQSRPAVAIDNDGEYVIVWDSNNQDGSSYGIYGQRFDAAGQAQGKEFSVNTTTTGSQDSPIIAMDIDGDFVVGWVSSGIYIQRFDKDGNKVGGETLVNTTTTGSPTRPSVAMDADGNFVVVWASTQDGSLRGIYGQRYDSSGSKQGGEFQINSYTTNDQFDPAVAMDVDGDFVVAWCTYSASLTDAEVWARRYDSAGSPVDTNDFQVNAYTTNYQFLQNIACNAQGDFLVTWSSLGQDGDLWGVYGQFYLADRTTQGAFPINTYTTSTQNSQAVASDYDCNFIVTWRSNGQDGSDYGIFARHLDRTYSYVADATGLVERYGYGRATTADQKDGDTTTEIGDDGDVAGALKSVWLQQGDMGTVSLGSLNQQSSLTYYEYKDGDDALVHPMASTTVYRNSDSTGAQTTEYEYSWSGTNIAPESVAVTLAKISTGQNGSDSADNTTTIEFDEFGRPISSTDAEGFVHSTEYALFGGITETIRDVGGLDLTTVYEVDALGRTTRSEDPNGSVTYTIYKDADHEVRVYPGWTGSETTGPVQVWREDWGLKYTDMMTLSGTVDFDTGVPTGKELLTDLDLETLTRSRVNNAGQLIQSDAYFNLSSPTYDPSSSFGTINTHFYRTSYDYDKRGRLKKTTTPTGTITRTEYDGLGRVISMWVGTNDTPAVGFWSFTNTAGTDMTEVAASVYDNGGIGDGNITYSLQYPGDAAARAMQMVSDWRNRPVISRTGVVSYGTSAPTVEFTASTYDVTESFVTDPNDDTKVVITVRLSAVSSLPTFVELTSGHKDDTASAGSDYTNPGTVVILIPAGQATATTTIEILGDASKESAETFTLTLANPTNASLGSTTTTTVTIRDQDDPASAALRFAAGGFTASERRSGSATVTLTQPVPGASFSYKLTAGSASLGSDIGSATGTFTFGDDETIALLSLPILNDAAVEGSETCTLEIFDLDGVTMSATTIKVTIIDDDFDPSGEDTDVNRPLSYVEYDNLNHVVVSAHYDGDALTITTPSTPSSSLRRSYRTTSFDDQGRVYRTDTYGVDYSGTKSTYSLYSQTWYNKRGLVMKSSQPGGQVVKNEFDGAGRVTKSFVTDGGGDTGYGDADDRSGDIVYTQTENRYGNQADDGEGTLLVETIRRDRFHDASGTGDLVDYDTNPKARVSYMGMYFDAANRLTDSVNVGTNTVAGTPTVWSRPGSAPGGSDTVLVTSYGYNLAGWVETTTDPRGIDSKTFYDDLGRTIQRVENYVNGEVSDQDDKTTDFAYDGAGHLVSYKAWLDDEEYQETGYDYGVTIADGHYVNSNDLLLTEKYPDKADGMPSDDAADQVSYVYSAIGQRISMTDRNGNVHDYSFDAVGRPTADVVSTLGSGVDGSVRRLDTAYDSAGRAYLFTSRAGTSDTATIVNQVQRGFNGLGQLTSEAQGHTSAGAGSAPTVNYAYSEMAGGVNHSRMISLTYPTDLSPDSTLTFNYSGDDASISRLTSISNDTITLESYSYLGLGTVVKRAHAQSGVDLNYVKPGESDDAGDQYIGLDRFGRVTKQRWLDSKGGVVDEFDYTYDEDGNRLTRDIGMAGAGSSDNYDEKYTYDALNQLTQFDRGVLSGGSIASPIRRQTWDPDAVGNFESIVTTIFGTSTSTVNGTFNRQNQQTESITGGVTTTLTYDNAGNTTDDGPNALGYDAWNRLVTVNSASRYAYDALGRRIKEDTRSMFYSSNWQVLEERNSGALLYRYAWSPVYVDAMIARDKFSGGSMTERLYVLCDANFNVTALVSTGGSVLERFVYDPYGTFTVVNSNWGSPSGSSSYGWVYLHQGGRWDNTCGSYYFRIRDYSPNLQRWLETDPLSFAAGSSNLYGYESNDPTDRLDAFGLIARKYKVCPIKWSEPRNFDDTEFRLPVKGRCERNGPYWRMVAPDGQGGSFVQDCKPDKAGEPAYIHFYHVPKGVNSTDNIKPWGTCVFDMAFNKVIAICDADGKFVGVAAWNVGILTPVSEADKARADEEFKKFTDACLNRDLSDSTDPMGDVRKCVDKYIMDNLKEGLLKRCNKEGDPVKSGGTKYCIRYQPWTPPK